MAQNTDIHKQKEATILLTKRFQKILEKEQALAQDIVENSIGRQELLQREIDEVDKLLQKQRALNEYYTQELLGLSEMNNVLHKSIKVLEEQCTTKRFLKYQATNVTIPQSDSGTEEQIESVPAQSVASSTQVTLDSSEEMMDSSLASGGEEKPQKSKWKGFAGALGRKK